MERWRTLCFSDRMTGLSPSLSLSLCLGSRRHEYSWECPGGWTVTVSMPACVAWGETRQGKKCTSPLSAGRAGPSSIKAFQCEECPRSYSSKYALVPHARQHTNSQLRACPFRGRTSTRADIIRVHMTNCVKKYIRSIEETALQMQGTESIAVGQDPDSYLLAITRLAAEKEASKEAGHAPSTQASSGDK